MTTPVSPGGGALLGILGGVCRPVLQILTLLQTKKCHFPHPVSDMEVLTKLNITCLRKTEIMSSLLRLKPQQKDFLKSVSNSHITLSFLFIWIGTTNPLIHNRTFFVNHTRFQTKMGKIYSRFQTKTAATHWVGTYLYGLYKGVPTRTLYHSALVFSQSSPATVIPRLCRNLQKLAKVLVFDG